MVVTPFYYFPELPELLSCSLIFSNLTVTPVFSGPAFRYSHQELGVTILYKTNINQWCATVMLAEDPIIEFGYRYNRIEYYKYNYKFFI